MVVGGDARIEETDDWIWGEWTIRTSAGYVVKYFYVLLLSMIKYMVRGLEYL